MTVLLHHPSVASHILELAQFDVLGDPKPQGSKTAWAVPGKDGGKPTARMKERHSDTHAAWRNAVATKTREVADAIKARGVAVPFDGPLGLTVCVRFAVPKVRARLVMSSPSGFIMRTGAPDLSKLIRAIEDALQAGGLITDDARICSLFATKVEVLGWTGAQILLTRDELAP